MLFLKIVFASLFFIPPLMLILPGILCLLRLRAGERESEDPAQSETHSHVDILLPLGGIIPDQEKILTSLLEQDHPNYRMLFIVDDQEDPVNTLINELCDRYPHAVKIVAGMGGLCAQKNHCLVQGLSNLAPETDIVVLCDGSNIADTGWLKRITYRVESGQVEVRTTHRAFNPIPHTLGGLCQAVYGSVILLGTQLVTYPWGGGTAIKRSLLERINIVDVWASNVTDDLTLGKVLEDEGISVELDVKNRLITPLYNQTVSAFRKFLDRQIIGPKFTNPGMWLTAVGFIFGINIAALLVLINLFILYPGGYTGIFFFVASLLFIAVVLFTIRLLHFLSPVDISFCRWLFATVPCLAMAALSAFRSIFRSYMDWHGRRYIVGKGGKVLDIVPDPSPDK